jgi:hypothetical protein
VAGVDGVLDELSISHPAIEVRGTQKMVVPAVDLAVARRTRCGRNRELEPRDALEQPPDERSLPDPGRAGDYQDRRSYRRRYETSSLRCRSERPPIVLLGEMRQ